MALRDYGFRVIPFVTNTATGVQTITIPSGAGSDKTPKAYELYTAGATALDTLTATARIGAGFSDGTNHRCVAAMYEDAGTATNADAGYRIDTGSVLQVISENSEGLVAEATHDSFATGQVKINWQQAPDAAYRCFAVIWFGDDLQANVTSFAGSATQDGTVSITDPGFEPKLLKFLSVGQAFVADGAGDEAMFCFGACGENLDQGCAVICAEDRQSPTSVGSMFSSEGGAEDGKVAIQLTSSGGTVSEGAHLEVDSLDTLGYTVATRNAAVSLSAACLAIRVPDVRMQVRGGVIDASTTGNITVLFDFLPLGAGFSAVRAAVSGSLSSAQGNIGIGACDGTDEATVAFNARDNQTTADSQSWVSNSVCIAVPNAADIDWAAEFVSFNNNGTSDRGVVLNITDAAGGDRVLLAWAIEKQLVLLPGGIASSSAFGTPSLTSTITLSPGGIASGSAFGTPTINQAGGVTLSPGGIPSDTAFGTPSLASTITLSPGGIASGSAFGTPTLIAGGVTLSPGGIASGTAFGTPSVIAGGVTVSPGGIASGSTFGMPSLASTITLSPGGIASGSAFGTPSVIAGADIVPPGIPSDSAFGTPSLASTITLSPGGIASSSAFGTPSLASTITLSPGGIASGSAFGTPTLVAGGVTLSPGGIASGTAFGTPALTATITLSPGGIASDAAFGTPTLVAGGVILLPGGIASGSAFGTPAVALTGAQTITAVGIPSTSRFGLPFVQGGAIPTTMKKRIHDALCERAHLGTFVAVTYPVDDEGCILEQGLQIPPRSVEVNEVRSTLATDPRHGRDLILDRPRWRWEMILRFDQEVVAELFERALEDEPVVVCRDPADPTSRQATLSRVDCDYRHPPRGAPSNGTELRYAFEALLSPK